eukprot:Sdes_comp21093_c0_seq1m19775
MFSSLLGLFFVFHFIFLHFGCCFLPTKFTHIKPKPNIMEKLIPVVNKLQDVFHTVGSESIQLPQIVVVGSQSSGKSSVLENLVGRDFLPRGAGICTRCPLVLQLIHVPPQSSCSSSSSSSYSGRGVFKEYGEFLHKPGLKFFDFSEIRREIEQRTVELSGANKGVSENPIQLKIYSSKVLNLTLVDLPGITKVAIGDQPVDIESQIHHLIKTYIENPNSLILAVTPANIDLANSDALKIALEYDPVGVRTIAVITKIDLMDSGTDAVDILTGRVYPVKLGIYGVVNRSQKDINENKDITCALEQEAAFFSSHASYRALSNRCGTAHLGKALSKHLMNHIRNCLPDLKTRINSLIAQTAHTLSALGNPLLDQVNKGALLLQVLTKFSTKFCQIVDGTAKELSTTELSGGARICYIFHETFGRTLDVVDPLEGLEINDIRTAIRNATGPRPALFVPEVSFEILVKKQIKRLEDPSLRCCELVHEELSRIVYQCESQELARFHQLRDKVVDSAMMLLKSRVPKTTAMIEALIEMELAYINTSHPDFVGGSVIVSNMMERKFEEYHYMQYQKRLSKPKVEREELPMAEAEVNDENASVKSNASKISLPENQSKAGIFNYLFGDKSKQEAIATKPLKILAPFPHSPLASLKPNSSLNLSDPPNLLTADYSVLNPREKIETELIQSLLASYFTIVRKNIQDAVPKAIMHFMVNYVKENIQSELVSSLYKEDMFSFLLEEAPEIAQQREDTVKMLNALKKASTILAEVREPS